MGNNRGTKYGLKHTSLSVDSDEFWDFDQEVMGLHDLPAIIDHILETTNSTKLKYIGHSEGTTQMFMAATLEPDYFKSKVSVFSALAPVTFMNNTKSYSLRFLAQNVEAITYLLHDVLHVKSIVPASFPLNALFTTFCTFYDPVCKFSLWMVSDREVHFDNMSRDQVYYSLFPSGCGWKNFVHYGQVIKTGGFLRYDFGHEKNLEKYGQSSPPSYDLSALADWPVALFHGTEDVLSDPIDVSTLASQIPESSLVFNRQYNMGHMTFHIGKDMSYLNDVLAVLSHY